MFIFEMDSTRENVLPSVACREAFFNKARRGISGFPQRAKYARNHVRFPATREICPEIRHRDRLGIWLSAKQWGQIEEARWRRRLHNFSGCRWEPGAAVCAVRSSAIFITQQTSMETVKRRARRLAVLHPPPSNPSQKKYTK